MNTAHFGIYSRYYNLLYRDKDYVSETDYIKSLLKEFAPGTKSIVEFGSGTGKHANLLAESGFLITCVEPSADMLSLSKNHT
ncbi:MAG: class I SAM-dependent methyltransferase, partial [Sphingobacteriales bacterium]